ncbi:MAG: CocE/NonD family hydrolase, partial [Ectothiorhodospiraceae bacterium]|nr:CocE/NonD family hydrolase [Ectothiorhodospiraceae bacterium]
AAHGYLVVIQDVRGRGSSEGVFEPFVNERDDGEDTLEWVAGLPGSSGKVGMYGFSYHGVAQLLAAATRHPALVTICPGMAGFHLFHDWAYEGGAFRLYNSMTWAAQLGAETARREGDNALYARRYRIGHGPSAEELIDPAGPVREQLRGTFYDDWIDSPADSDYWALRSPGLQLEGISLPSLHIGGWYDSFLTGTLDSYAHFSKGPAPCRLIVGPWGHLPWTAAVGERWFGDEAQSAVDVLQLRWFDHFLKGNETGVLDEAPVQLYDLRAGIWRDSDSYAEQATSRWHLDSIGSANIDLAAGRLAPEPVADGEVDTLVSDPWRPVPTLGGHLAPSVGICDRTALDARPDVLTYTSEPLADELQLLGPVSAVLACEADTDSFDLCAVLCVVGTDGRVQNLTQGYLRATGAGPHRISLRGTCARIAPGERLRLSVSGACYPAYALNDGSGRPQGQIRATDYPVITIRMQAADSWLSLPCAATTDSA